MPTSTTIDVRYPNGGTVESFTECTGITEDDDKITFSGKLDGVAGTHEIRKAPGMRITKKTVGTP